MILAFYRNDWSRVCSDQLSLFNEPLLEFQRLGAELFGISVDGAWCHMAFADDRKPRFPLLADFEQKGEVARRVEAMISQSMRLSEAGSIVRERR